MNYLAILVMILWCLHLPGQSLDEQLQEQILEKTQLEAKLSIIDEKIEGIKLQLQIIDLKNIGLPTDDYIEHSAMILSYSEQHEQAAWVSHIISPDIIDGTIKRTDDFREDPLVSTGTAVEADYFLKYLQPDSTYKYDGFGYDQGHLAPSADFKWSKTAVSESFYYSNMSPQLESFNQKIWKQMEIVLREYVVENRVPLYIVTLPILEDDLPKVKRSINGVSIPREFIKVALDPKNNQSIAFKIENKKANNQLASYAITIDEAEAITGFDFFSHYNKEEVESKYEKDLWFPEMKGNREPLKASDLPPGHYNTVNAARYVDSKEEISVCGYVAGTKYINGEVLYINLDRDFPNQMFTIVIFEDDLDNFSSDIEVRFKNKDFCFTGKVKSRKDKPQIIINNKTQVKSISEISN